MRVRFWGTRGSLPVSITADDIKGKIVEALLAAAGRNLSSRADVESFVERDLPFAISHTYGGNSSCVELDLGTEDHVLCDLGTGARSFGLNVLARKGLRTPCTFHVFISHLHWDHIMGFPFFGPAYVPGTHIRIHGCHDVLESAFRLQQAPPCFPVEFSQLAADIEFLKLAPGRAHEISGVRVTPAPQMHSGDSYGYRFETDGKVIVYTTDSEHKLENRAQTERFVQFFQGADLVVFDAMYSLADAISVKADWGHSSNIIGVELCQMARVRHLVLFHHEPAYDDATIEGVLREIFPIESYDKKLSLSYLRYELGKPRYEPDECRQLRLTYGRPFRIWLRLNKEQPIEEEVYLGDLPIMLGGGEFIINGAERVVVSQLHRSPGIDYFEDRELRRHAGVFYLWALGVAAVISGDFSGWNLGFAVGGWGGMFLGAIIITIMYLGLTYSIAEMSPALPHTGGAYSFARTAFGPWGGFITGVAENIEYVLTPAVIALLAAFPVLIVAEGVVAPIELLSTVGNVLSYARIMALGVASVMLAVVANRMVGAIGSVAVGVVFALLFHLVNFAIALFSPTIHALRLHYVEFFGTFYSPGGTRYQPLGHWSPPAARTA